MRFFVASLLLVLAGSAWAERPTVSTEEAIKVEAMADLVVDYAADGKLDIGIGVSEVADGERAWKPTCFAFEELKTFFAIQRHKDLVVIVLAKRWNLDERDEELREVVDKLTRYFFAAGYKRVVIQQGLGDGRGTHSDKTNPQQSGPARLRP